MSYVVFAQNFLRISIPGKKKRITHSKLAHMVIHPSFTHVRCNYMHNSGLKPKLKFNGKERCESGRWIITQL